jgi:hypothetical protein
LTTWWGGVFVEFVEAAQPAQAQELELGDVERGEAEPTISVPHWTNSRNQPWAGRSARQTGPMAQRLHGESSREL